VLYKRNKLSSTEQTRKDRMSKEAMVLPWCRSEYYQAGCKISMNVLSGIVIAGSCRPMR